MVRVLVAAIVLAAVLGARSLSAPRTALACSCVQRGGLGDLVGKPDVIVVSGTIVELDNVTQHGTFAVARLYQGVLPGPSVPIRGGGGGDCTVNLAGAVNVVMVARIEAGVLVPGLCSPFGDLATAEGRQLLQQINAAFGIPSGPPSQDDASIAPAALLAVIAAVLVSAVALFGLVVLVTRRRVRATEDGP